MYRQQSLITLHEFYELKPLTKLEAILSFIDFTPFLKIYPDFFKEEIINAIQKSNFFGHLLLCKLNTFLRLRHLLID